MKHFQTKNGVQLTLLNGGLETQKPLEGGIGDISEPENDVSGSETPDESPISKGVRRTLKLSIGRWFKLAYDTEEVA